MGAKPTTIGGGSARGVSDALSNTLMQGLQGGFQIGGQQTAGQNLGRANPMGDTLDIGSAIATLLNGGSNLANSATQIADIRRKENVADIRSRYALGGTGYGTPASSGEARFLSEYDPQVATQVGGMQLDSISKALGLVLPLYQQAYGLGTPQAQTVMKQSGFMNGIGAITGLAGAAAPFFAPGLGAGMSAASAGAGALMPKQGGQLGQAAIYHFPGMQSTEGQGSYLGGFGSSRDVFGTPFDLNQAFQQASPWAQNQPNPMFSQLWNGNL